MARSSACRFPLAAALMALTATGLAAAPPNLDPSAVRRDSEVVLELQLAGGSLRNYRASLTTWRGATTLLTTLDGQPRTGSVPGTDGAALWEFLRQRNVAALTDVQPAHDYPDLATVVITVRVGCTTHRVTAYGVEFLPDPRYREIVDEILRLTDAAGAGPAR